MEQQPPQPPQPPKPPQPPQPPQPQQSSQPPRKGELSFLQVIGIVAAAMLVTMAATVWVVKSWLFPQPFTPVRLTPAEQQQLERKLEKIEQSGSRTPRQPAEQRLPAPNAEDLRPEAYSEAGASREIRFSERELNGLIARNTDLADRLVVHLSRDLVSIKLLMPMDPDFPLLGGKVLKVRAGAELAYRSGRPVVILRGVSVMGVPLPAAWLGGLKNIDLIKVFGAEPGFWKGFADGVAAMEVSDGELRIVLRE